MNRSSRMLMLSLAIAGAVIAIVACRRASQPPADSLPHQEAKFFSLLDAVSIQNPTLTTVSITRTRSSELPESFSARGCQCCGLETRTLKTAAGLELRIASCVFAISGGRLQQGSPNYVFAPVSDPWFHLSEMFIDGQLVRAIADRELKVDLNGNTVPVRYAKWQEPNGNFIHAYSSWFTADRWVIPLDRTFTASYTRGQLPAQQLHDGLEILRIDVRVATEHETDEVPLDLIQQVLVPFSEKLLATPARES